MDERIRMAFDCVYAEDGLKTGTMEYLRHKIREKSKPVRRFPVVKTAVVLGSVAGVVFAGVCSYKLLADRKRAC